MSPSPMLKALDLTRVDIGAMSLGDLEDHANEVLNTLGALNEYINSPVRKSANSKQAALTRARALRLHMARVRDLIQVRQAAAVIACSAQVAGVVNQPLGAPPFGL